MTAGTDDALRPTGGAIRVAWFLTLLLTVLLATVGFVDGWTRPQLLGGRAANDLVAEFGLHLETTFVVGLIAPLTVLVGVAGFVFRRRPDDRMAVLFGIAVMAFGALASKSLGVAFVTRPVLRPAIVLLSLVAVIALGLLVASFPDGRVTPRFGLAAPVLLVVGLAVYPSFAEAILALPDLPDAPGRFQLAVALVSLGSLTGVSAQAVRYRTSSPLARQQIKWLFAPLGVFVLALVLVLLGTASGVLSPRAFGLGLFLLVPYYLLMPMAWARAILRYRLYDIDVVISRSLVVAVLAGFIGSVYVAVVVGVGRLVGVGDGSSLTLKVVATAIVAVAFQPLRQRVRRWADRVVFGHRATPYEVLAGFSQAASAGDEDNLQRIAEMLAAGTGAQPATVWLRVGDQLRAVATSDDRAGVELVARPLEGGELPALPASLVVPVRHDDELLGAVSLTKPRSEPPTRQDEELAGRLARGLALVLRNARLTAELREHLAALQASRSRLVRAQDEARRAIESQLRTGAQQQLEALKSRLGGVARAAATAGAVRTAALLEQLEGEADDADDTLRALGQGIYPPLLEAEGLGVAVAAQAARSTLPVTVHASGLPRYPGEVEVAVYFSILEALQNAAKYAQASSVHVRLEPRGDGLWFEVADDGIGFDPHHTSHGSGLTGIAARLDTIDATLNIHSHPGTGTRITGHVPTPPTTTAPTPIPAHSMEVPA